MEQHHHYHCEELEQEFPFYQVRKLGSFQGINQVPPKVSSQVGFVFSHIETIVTI